MAARLPAKPSRSVIGGTCRPFEKGFTDMTSTPHPTHRSLERGEIRIRVLDYELGQPGQGPGTRIGREILGEIVEIGPDVSGPVLGQRVTVWAPVEGPKWGPPPPVMAVPVRECTPER